MKMTLLLWIPILIIVSHPMMSPSAGLNWQVYVECFGGLLHKWSLLDHPCLLKLIHCVWALEILHGQGWLGHVPSFVQWISCHWSNHCWPWSALWKSHFFSKEPGGKKASYYPSPIIGNPLYHGGRRNYLLWYVQSICLADDV